MNGIVVSVEYDDLLAITLPRNATHFERILVVTSPADEATQDLVSRTSNAEVHTTDAFYRHGAAFNKGLALEEGFEVLGRDGWLVVWDADIVMPQPMDLEAIEVGNLYSPHRRMCRNLAEWQGQIHWKKWPIQGDREHAGYFQLFHGQDPVLRQRPWYGTDWRHAGGCDSDFQAKWPNQRRRRLSFEVLHLGVEHVNWHGRSGPRVDGSLPPEAGARREAQRKMYADRRRHGFQLEKIRPKATGDHTPQ
ncbi:MAG: hypothetical protein A2V98_19855 [Planctomycetes bacterium RBG_16_64_12]|nr:MAG: hypothetical protein A2V98_19855 [Planctomycetes bacterium RBG_16_64_12]